MSPTAPPPSRLSTLVRAGIEYILLALVVLSPWAFGAVHPLSLFVLYAGIGICLALWAVLLLAERKPPRNLCPVVVCIGAMVLLGVWQLAPLPSWLLGVVAPGSERAWS